MTVEGSGTSVELIGLTLTGGAVVLPGGGAVNSSTSALLGGSLLFVTRGASLVGHSIQMSQSKNAPALVVANPHTYVEMNGLSSSVHSDGAIRIEDRGTFQLTHALFSSNVGAYGVTVVATNEVLELSSVRRSLGILCVAQFFLLTVTMEIAGRVGIFSIRRLPRGRPQLSVAAIGVLAFGLELLSLRRLGRDLDRLR